MKVESTPSGKDGRDSTTLVSLIVVATDGLGGLERDLERIASSLSRRFAFYELLLIGSAEDPSVEYLAQRISRAAPQFRVLQLEGANDFDRMAMHGYQECIGDIIVMSSADEISHVDVVAIVEQLRMGEELVRLRRKKGSALERASSFAVQFITGLKVDTRFLRTLGLNRQLLSELLARPEEIHLFRFTAHTLFAPQTIIEIEQAQTRSGLRLFFRRIDLVTRLVATSAPRLLRIASALCLMLSVLALLALVYVGGVWLFRDEIAEGWTSITSIIALWMFVQLAATSALCVGMSRVLDRQERARLPRLVNEVTVSDLFANSGLLNVESDHFGEIVPAPSNKRS